MSSVTPPSLPPTPPETPSRRKPGGHPVLTSMAIAAVVLSSFVFLSLRSKTLKALNDLCPTWTTDSGTPGDWTFLVPSVAVVAATVAVVGLLAAVSVMKMKRGALAASLAALVAAPLLFVCAVLSLHMAFFARIGEAVAALSEPATPDPATNAPIAGEALCDAMPKLNSCEHLFSAQTPGMDFICLEGWPNDPNTTNRYCAVFTNGALSRIVSSPILPQRPGYPQGSPALDPESFVQLVLASTNRVPTETVLKRDAETGDKPQHVDWGLTAAFLAVRVACAPFSAKPVTEDNAPSDKSIMETMNPLLVRLGMDRTTLEERIGPPRFSRQTKASETIYYYGRPPKSIYNEGRCWLGIRYESNAVIRVYTGRMLDHSAIDNFQL